ncbi:MAG: ABC transporter permease [Victivallaceae bacterium]|nr:ABC transporter permease [Victivallaceae bacterium]
MFQYLVKRIALALLTAVVIMAVSYVLLRLAPGDPARSSVIGETGSENLSAEHGAFAGNEATRRKLHLDKPIYVGLYYWFKNLVTRGDFGESVAVDAGRPVVDVILERLPVTVILNAWAIFLTYLMAIPLGIYAAVYPDSTFDRITTIGLFFLYSLPPVWVALVLQAGLCEGGLFPIFPLKGNIPTSGMGASSWQILWNSMYGFVLPVLCLSYGGFAALSRYARSGMIDVLGHDFIRTARAKGLPEHIVLFKHALRNAMIILVTIFAGLLPGLVAGSIIVEYVFSINGMGALSLLALNSRDYPLQMALFCFGGGLTLAGIMVSDLLYVVVDPRITFNAR